jgi:hypothetical protein
MSNEVYLVYNGYGDAVICKTKKQAESEAEDLDMYRAFFFGDSAHKYICVMMKCTLDRAKAQIELIKQQQALRSNVSYF